MLRAYLINYVYTFERLPEHCIFRVNLGSVINIFTVLGLIFSSQGYLLNEETIFFRILAVL